MRCLLHKVYEKRTEWPVTSGPVCGRDYTAFPRGAKGGGRFECFNLALADKARWIIVSDGDNALRMNKGDHVTLVLHYGTFFGGLQQRFDNISLTLGLAFAWEVNPIQQIDAAH
jgi:hypothetical protein